MTPLREREREPGRVRFIETESMQLRVEGWVVGRENRDFAFNGERVSV